MKTIFSIQGNIGSGKTTLLSLLQSHFKLNSIRQPVEQWQNLGKHNLLSSYYDNPNRWAFTFQINAILTRMSALHQTLHKTNANLYLSERSIQSDREIFARLLRETNVMNEMEYNIYTNMYDSLEKLFQTPKIHKYIYLKTSPFHCHQRILKRARKGEHQITLQYLQKIHKLHEKWMINQNCFIINGDNQFQTNPKTAQSIISQIIPFLKN